MSRIIPEGVPPCDLPAEADVVVIGGGIVGVSTAWFLARKGVRVVLCEKGVIAGEQSGRNWGWVRQMGRDVGEIPLAVHSLRLWREMNAQIGADSGYRQTGITYVCRTEAEMEAYRDWLRHARDHQIDTVMLDAKGLDALIPGMTGFVGGLHTASDGRAEPWLAAPAIARAAIGLGASIVGGCAVRGIEREAGRVSGVVTERGVVRCRQVVVAGGAWSRYFLRSLGVELPILKVIGSVARLAPVDGVTDMPVGASDFAFRRRLDGGFTFAARNTNMVPIVPDSFRFFTDFSPHLVKSWRELRLRVNGRFLEELRMPKTWGMDDQTAFEQVRILDPVPNPRYLAGGIGKLAAAVPAFRDARITQSWAGMIDVTPDAVPVIDASPIPGLHVATGFSGHGFGIGPAAGQMMAQMLMGETPLIDPAPFRLARFARAAKPQPQAVPA